MALEQRNRVGEEALGPVVEGEHHRLRRQRVAALDVRAHLGPRGEVVAILVEPGELLVEQGGGDEVLVVCGALRRVCRIVDVVVHEDRDAVVVPAAVDVVHHVDGARGRGDHARGVLDGVGHGVVAKRCGVDLAGGRDFVGDHAVVAVVRVAAAVDVALAMLDVGVGTAAERHHDAAVVLGSGCGLGPLARVLRGVRALLARRGGLAALVLAAKRRKGEPRSPMCRDQADGKRHSTRDGDDDPAANGAGALLLAMALGIRAGLLRPGGRLRACGLCGHEHAHLAGALATTLARPLAGALVSPHGLLASRAANARLGTIRVRSLGDVARDADVVPPHASPVVVLPVCHEPSPIRSWPPNTTFSALKDSKARGLQLRHARPAQARDKQTASWRGTPCPR